VASSLTAVKIVESRVFKSRDSIRKTTNLVWSTMNPKTFKIRYRVSLGLYVLGFTMPAILGFYLMLRNPGIFSLVGSIFVIFPLWLPVTLFLWLVSAYVTPVPTYRKIAWVGFILGLLMSIAWGYLLVGALSH
jgi:hypothetical protein